MEDRRGAVFRPEAALLGRFPALPAVAVVFFFMAFPWPSLGLPCAGTLFKACRDSPRQDSPFLFPRHALDERRVDRIIGLCFWIPEQN
jgi:hypothetical protein